MMWPVLIPIVAIIGAFTAVIVATLARTRLRELEVRERIAMIEKGLVPPPEVDPRGFERSLYRADRDRCCQSAVRHRRAGITLIGVGVGLMVLISLAGESPAHGLGVGGFVAILGLAFLINSLFEQRHQLPAPENRKPPASPAAPNNN